MKPFFIFLLLHLAPNTLAQVWDIEIDPKHRHQVIEGFGTCVIDFMDSPEMPEYFDDSLYNMAVYDLGMSILRLSFPQTMEWQNDNGDPDHFNWPAFNMVQLHKRMKVAQAFQKRGVDRVMVSTWSPPEFTKTNKSTIFAGHLRMDMYEEYAENFAAMVIAAKKNWGIDVGAVGLQNELLFIEPYKSAIYNPYQAREAVKALQRKFQREGITSKIIMPEEMMDLYRMKTYITPTMEDKETRGFHGALASHRLQEGDKLKEWRDFAAPFGKQSWMTETSGHPTDWQGALEVAEDIHEHLVLGNFSAWIYWQLSENKTDVYALMDKHKPLPKYHASKHFYRYIRPGAVRVEASNTGEVMASAFIHPVSGQLTVVLVNNSPSPGNIRISVKGGGITPFTGFLSTEGNYFQDLKPLAIGEGLAVPAKSVITLVTKDGRFATQQSIGPWPEAWKVPEGDPLDYYGTMEPEPSPTAGYLGILTRNGEVEKLREELKGKDINTPFYNGWTLLHHAALSGQLGALDLLLESGADIEQEGVGGWKPLHAAAATFVGKGKGGEKVAKTDILQRLLQERPDITAVTDENWTALHVAAMNSHTAYNQQDEDVAKRISLLAQAGIPVDAKDNRERTALHWAAWQGYEQMVTVKATVVEALLQNGATVDAKDMEGNTPLYYAVKMGYLPIINTLLEAGADPGAMNKQGESPIVLAEKRGYWQVRKLLAGEAGTEGEAPQQEAVQGDGKLGMELLQAAWKGNAKEVRRLLKAGADVHFRDSDGFRAIDRARDGGHQEIVNMIQGKMAEK